MNGIPNLPTSISRRSLLRGLGAGGALAFSGALLAACTPAGGSPGPGAAGKITDVTLQFDWIPFGRYAPFYAADSLGYYKDAGVNVNLLEGSGVGPGFSSLISGNSDISVNDLGYLVQVGHEQKVDLVATAVFYSVAPHSVFYLESAGINSPRDLEGKTVAYSAGQSPYLLFGLFAQANGVDMEKINWQQVAPQALNQTFLSKQADAMVTYVLTGPVLEENAPDGDVVKHFMFGEHGVKLLNNGLIVMKSLLEDQPDVVKAVTQATVKGYEYSFANPEKAMDLMKQKVPTVSVENGIKELNLIKSIAQLPEDSDKPLGWINPEAMAETVETMSEFFKISPAPRPESFYTNQFVS